jgi:hypothetical protein
MSCHPMIFQVIENACRARGGTPSPLRGEGGGEGGAMRWMIVHADFKNVLIEPDCLLIYEMTDTAVILSRTATHADLFG